MSALTLLNICWLTCDMAQFERAPKKISGLTLQEPFDLLKLNPSPQKSYFRRDMYQFQSPFLKAQQLDSKGLHFGEFSGVYPFSLLLPRPQKKNRHAECRSAFGGGFTFRDHLL